MIPPPHKSGFVSILGKPNAGKSTLMNILVGAPLATITPKVQTTRHRIVGVQSRENFQIVYADTPGIIDTPAYALQEAMMRAVKQALVDADVLLYLIDARETPTPLPLPQNEVPLLLILNKIDLIGPEAVTGAVQAWNEQVQATEIIPVSALKQENTALITERILVHLPVHPAYYEKDTLTDRSERFFAAEIIREKILLNYQQEIPYSVEVVIDRFKEKGEVLHIRAELWVERPSQKPILIGKKGEALKQVGIQARQALECFFNKKIFLEQHVRVVPGWRENANLLIKLGYR